MTAAPLALLFSRVRFKFHGGDRWDSLKPPKPRGVKGLRPPPEDRRNAEQLADDELLRRALPSNQPPKGGAWQATAYVDCTSGESLEADFIIKIGKPSKLRDYLATDILARTINAAFSVLQIIPLLEQAEHTLGQDLSTGCSRLVNPNPRLKRALTAGGTPEQLATRILETAPAPSRIHSISLGITRPTWHSKTDEPEREAMRQIRFLVHEEGIRQLRIWLVLPHERFFTAPLDFTRASTAEPLRDTLSGRLRRRSGDHRLSPGQRTVLQRIAQMLQQPYSPAVSLEGLNFIKFLAPAAPSVCKCGEPLEWMYGYMAQVKVSIRAIHAPPPGTSPVPVEECADLAPLATKACLGVWPDFLEMDACIPAKQPSQPIECLDPNGLQDWWLVATDRLLPDAGVAA